MTSRGPYRRHTPQFKLQLCQEIRSGALGRRDAQEKYSLSANVDQLWLTQYDRGERSILKKLKRRYSPTTRRRSRRWS
jgi:transposase-like protein